MRSQRALLAVGFVGVVATAACSTPPLSLRIGVSAAEANACGGDTCSDVTMSCDAVVSIRILDPKDPRAPYISICQDVTFNQKRNLCSLASIELPPTPLPVATLEVQVVMYPTQDVPRLPREDDPAITDPACSELAQVDFDGVNGFPLDRVEVSDPANPSTVRYARPAIGGRAYYHPGDDRTVVKVGCPDLVALNGPSCAGNRTVAVTATATDFDTNQPVSPSLGNRLGVSIGEPIPTTGSTGLPEYILNPSDTDPLDHTVLGPVPAWGADVEIAFMKWACLEVLEDIPQATAALTCRAVSPLDTSIDIPGVRLAKETLDPILSALGDPPLDKGLVIGIVLDELGPSEGRVVTAVSPGTDEPTIRYLSTDGTTFNAATTTGSGIFVSQDAPFGTLFSSTRVTTVFAPGGLVNNKITIVVLQFGKPPVGG